jgi:hypothetical protein
MTKIKYLIEAKFVIVDNKNIKRGHKYERIYATESLDDLISLAEQKLGVKPTRQEVN